MQPISPPVSEEMLQFTLSNPVASTLSPRLGSLAIAGRKSITTPHVLPLSSRGALPHIAHDVLRDHTSVASLYLGLEDFLERQHIKSEPPLYKIPTAPHESALRNFTCLPDDIALIMGPRRVPPIACPPDNTTNSIAISTMFGFRQLEATQYVDAVRRLCPDIVVGLADLRPGQSPGAKRRGKMVDRTHAYTMHATEQLYGSAIPESSRSPAAYFAPVLPLDNAEQSIYLEDLEHDLRSYLSGLALYESASLSLVPDGLASLPRLLLSDPETPHDILRDVSLGADLLTVPFLSACSDAGIALDFVFPAPTSESPSTGATAPRPLAFDLWSTDNHPTDTGPLSPNCTCYACKSHHRAYVHHLLTAKEMLAWTLLQIHNLHTIDCFFAGIRESISRGTFDADAHTFHRTYDSELPERKGQGPRLRGHQLPAAGPYQPRPNPRAFGRLDDALQKFAESQSSVATPDTGADGLEEHGFAQKESS
ncbi:tRNA-ribosyltransferase family protein [Aspergillus candidus]|uniref:Queuine tRNA-ribosyltransferase accessory subunit 2 n=1 Tax=Aspergillus candidus TaxID=41067 RepID=A0A2I2FP05_ASPCN|nr:tRNA-guanine transglycosylase family protein [Aspergillus candidus]PLB42355.1 tRNA-guanine transglycosylase family protein [Aspergillus candidus]